VEVAELNLSYCRITAPMDGLLGDTAASEGQMVGPGYTVQLNQLVQLDPMWVEFSPSATEWPLIRERMEMAGEDGVRAKVAYGGVAGIEADAVLGFASNVVNASTSTIMLRATFANPAGAFRPGTFCTVRLDLGEIPGVVMIPTSALVARETDFFVWRVKSDGTVENVRVKATIREEERVGVTEGVVAGDRVVTAGVQKLREGAKVVEQQAAGSPGARSGN
jgi:membrane fusion protein (multidrug efflux system)